MDLIDVVGLDEEIRCEMCRNPMHTNRGCDGHCKYDEKLYERIIQILDKRITPSPSAEPERKTGKWKIREDMYGDTEATCSECGFETVVDQPGNNLHMLSDLHFCPSCGAKMEGEEDD